MKYYSDQIKFNPDTNKLEAVEPQTLIWQHDKEKYCTATKKWVQLDRDGILMESDDRISWTKCYLNGEK